MNCKNCNTPLPENQTKCPNCGTENIPEAQTPTQTEPANEYISAAGAERAVPKGFSSKRNIIIIIIAAIVLIIGGVTAVAVTTNGFDFSGVRTTLQLADRYLSEQNYEQAIIEFEKVLEIEPMNVDAYLGLVEAYMALGETDKAVKVLEEGIEKTGSDKLRDKLEEIRESLKPVITEAEVAVTITVTAPTPVETAVAIDTVGETTVTETTFAETVAAETEPEPAATTTTVKTEPVVTTTAETKPVVTTTKPEPAVTESPVEEGTVTILGVEYDIATTTSLVLHNDGITDEILKEIVPKIKKLTNLTGLWLYNNQITDTAPLAQLTNLTLLDLGKNQITDITSLVKLTNLTELYLDHNQITDITPLAQLTNLTWLWLSGNPISEQDIEYLKSKLPNCAINY